MFGITHWIIVLLVALMVFGPEKLPELARTLGRALAEFRRASLDFRRVIEDELAEIERQTRERALRAASAPTPSTAPSEPAGVVPATSAALSGPNVAGVSGSESNPALASPAEGHADES